MTSNPEPNIEQLAENSTLNSGMQAIQGDNNLQLQGNSQLTVQKIFENVRVLGNITVGNISQIYQTVNNLSEIPKPTSFPQNIPSSNTDRFIGRVRELERLYQQLQRNNEVVIAAVEGMGGVGKTELAIQYSLLHLQLHTYPGGICWLRAREEDIGLQIIEFTRTDLGLQPPEDLELPERIRWCWQRWQQGNTLVVVDDVKDYSQIKLYLPPQPSQFKVLITTRLKLDLTGSLFLSVLQSNDALELLSELVGKEKVTLESTKAKELVQRLGYLPLALQLIGRYVKKRKISLTEMLQRLEEKGLGHPSLEVKENDPTWTDNIKHGVAAAFELNWEQLSESAQELGCLLSLFALAPISWFLVKSAAADLDAEELEDAKVELEDLHLLTGEDTHLLHRLIREFLRNKQKNLASGDSQKSSFCQVMLEVSKYIPNKPNQNQITDLTPAIPHLEEVAKNLTASVSDENLIWVFTSLGWFYKGQGLYAQAQPWLEQGVSVVKFRLGEEHPHVAASYSNLAILYHSQGRYTEAEPLLIKALELDQRLLGEEHPHVAASYSNLANIYLSQGRYTEAEPLLIKALELYQRLLGEEHPHVALNYGSLAELYRFQGRYTEAEALFIKALELNQRLLGEEHPDVALSYNNLANLYLSQGRYTEAEPLLIKALELNQRLLGEEHPDVALSYNNLALVYRSQGRYTEAEPLLIKALELNQRLLGEEHPHVALSYGSLAELYRLQGRYTEAEPHYIRALELYQGLIGEEHPHVALSYNNLASLYLSQKRYTEAEPLLKKALELYQGLLGEEHPHVAAIYNNLANLYLSQGRYTEAEPLLKKALELQQRLLGEEHPHVAAIYHNLANLYHSQGRYSEAEPLLKKALELMRRLLGEEHPDVATSYHNLANLYFNQGRYSEAEPLLKKALELMQRLLGQEHPHVAAIYNNLANLYFNQGRYSEAEPLSKKAPHANPQRIVVDLSQKNPLMQSYKIGLDFGTTNSTISYIENGNLEAFQYGGPDGQKYIPSFIAYDNGLTEVGLSARETSAHQPNIESYGNFKMQLPLSESEFCDFYQINRTPSSVTTDYLREILISSENQFSFSQEQGEITKIVVSVPEIWQHDINNTGRENLQRIIEDEIGFGDKLIQLVSEPVAAAAYYVWENQQRNKNNNDQLFSGNLLVCDMGGGTFDISLCKIYDSETVEVLYFDGQGYKGLESAGVAFDRRCVQTAYTKRHGQPLDESSVTFKKLMRDFESRKISGHNRFTKKLKEYLQNPERLKDEELYTFGDNYSVKNEEVNEAFAPISKGISRVIERVKTWLKNNNQNFERLFLVGGFCQFYLVQQSICESLSITDNDPRYDKSFNIANSAYAISFGSCLIANNLVNPSEKFIHSVGVLINKEVQIPSIRGLKYETQQISVTLINGNTTLDQLSEPIFEERTLIAHQPNFPVKIWINPESKEERYTIEQVIDLPNYSPEAKYRVGMRVNRSQIAYLIIKEVDNSVQVEYELGNIITKLFPSGYLKL